MLRRVDVLWHRFGRASCFKGWNALCSFPNSRMLCDWWTLSTGVQHFFNSLLPTQYHLSDLTVKLWLLIGKRRKTLCLRRRTHINSMVILRSTRKTEYPLKTFKHNDRTVISSTDKYYLSTHVCREPFSLITKVIESPLVWCYALFPNTWIGARRQDRLQRSQPLYI